MQCNNSVLAIFVKVHSGMPSRASRTSLPSFWPRTSTPTPLTLQDINRSSNAGLVPVERPHCEYLSPPTLGPHCFQCRSIDLVQRTTRTAISLRLPLLSHRLSGVPHQPRPHCGPKGSNDIVPHIRSVQIYIGITQVPCSGVVDATRKQWTVLSFGFIRIRL